MSQVDDTDTLVSTIARPALHAAVTVDGMRVDLLTCHLKSKLLTFPGGAFSTSDEALRARFAQRRAPGRNHTNPVRASRLGNRHRRLLPIRPRRRRPVVELAERILPATERYSRIYQGRHELIDHILASHHITKRTNDGDLTAGPAPDSIGDNPNTRENAPGSDHRPLVLRIDTTAASRSPAHPLTAAGYTGHGPVNNRLSRQPRRYGTPAV